MTQQGGDLVVKTAAGGAQRVDWSASGHRVGEEAGLLVIRDRLGLVQAREGDFVRFGGGDFEGLWRICGEFEVAAQTGRIEVSRA